MANYMIPENPQYTTEIRKIEQTDPVNADAIVNPLVETLIENTHAVKLKADRVDDLQEQIDSHWLKINGKADATHTHSPDDLSEIVPISKGGTGNAEGQAASAVKLANPRSVQVDLSSGAAANFDGSADINPGVRGVMAIKNGGTGATTSAQACANIGALPLAGGTITGNLTLKGAGNFGNKINFGDGDYVHISEPTDDVMEIKAKRIQLVTNNTDYASAQARNISASTTDLTAGTSSLANGDIYLVYE